MSYEIEMAFCAFVMLIMTPVLVLLGMFYHWIGKRTDGTAYSLNRWVDKLMEEG